MTTLYSDHLPTSFLWWALNGTTAGIMIFGGEYVCMQHEMEPILLGGGGGGSSSNQEARSGPSGTGTGARSTTNHARTRSNANGTITGVSTSSASSTSNTAHSFIQSQHKASRSGRYDASSGDLEESAGLLMMDSLDHLHHDASSISPGGPGVSSSSAAAAAIGSPAQHQQQQQQGPVILEFVMSYVTMDDDGR
ncbi:hypothetical protein BGW42_007362 [Actinomortierella wolfii]|nr:hypothetical protein BGW42_007362 [Actinomortierella wolfii]